jgi:hypothetical protein
MKKAGMLPLYAALFALSSCTAGGSGNALTIANAKTYLTDPTSADAQPVKNADGSYTGNFTIDSSKYGLTSDTKGEVTFTATPTEFKTVGTTSEVRSKALAAISGVKGTFVAKKSTGSSGGEYYLSCTGTFTITVTLDDGFDTLTSVAISDFTYTSISGSVQNG